MTTRFNLQSLACFLAFTLASTFPLVANDNAGARKAVSFYINTTLYDNDTVFISTKQDSSLGRHCETKEMLLELISQEALRIHFINCDLSEIEVVSKWLGKGRRVKLYFQDCRLDQDSLKSHAGSWQVAYLNLCQCHILKGEPLHLDSENLRFFSLIRCNIKTISSPVLAELANCHKIEVLTLEGLKVDKLHCIRDCKALRHVNLTNCKVEEMIFKTCNEVGISDLSVDSCDLNTSTLNAIATIQSLEHLFLANEAVAPEVVLHWRSTLRDLAGLHFDAVSLNRDLLRSIEGFPKLWALSLMNCHLTDDLLAKLPKLENLTGLDLRGNDALTNDAVESLAKFEKLSSLNIEGSSISDDGVIAAVRIGSIEIVRCNAKFVSDDVSRRIQLATPRRVLVFRY